jgi:glycosyltransferase involved in cell wall biosynthesis
VTVRTVLVIAYYFPPAGGPGVQRVLKFVRYLRDFGWEPVVLTVDRGSYPELDPSLMSDVPDGVRVFRTPALDPLRIYGLLTGRGGGKVPVGSLGEARSVGDKIARWIRANLFIPDARVGWYPFAVRMGERLISGDRASGIGPIDAIVSSGPPHSVHLIARTLSRRTAIPWVADFRDPWVDINYAEELPRSVLARWIDQAFESSVLRQASRVTTVSPSWARLLSDKPAGGQPVEVIHNGFDEEDFPPGDAALDPGRFFLSHIGSLYASRNPVALWEALSKLDSAGKIPALMFRVAGSIDPGIERSLDEWGLRKMAQVEGYISHEEAVRMMRSSHLQLLSIEHFPAERGMITGKLYEYLAAGRPVLALGPAGGDAAELLRATGGGTLFRRDAVSDIANEIERHYLAWAAGRPLGGASMEAIAPFSRKRQTERLAAVLEEGLRPHS